MSVFRRKQTLFVFIICVLIVAGTYLYVDGQFIEKDKSKQVVTINNEINQRNISTSTDWQKLFFDSNAKNTAFKNITDKKTNTNTPNPPLTMTDQLSRDIFTRYALLKQAGLLDNAETVGQTLEDSITSQINPKPPKSYSASDIIVVATNPVTLIAFSSRVGEILDSYKITKGESSIIQDYLTNNDAVILKSFDPIIKTYTQIISNLLKAQVPQAMSSSFIDLINAFSALKTSAEDLKMINTDSVRAMAGINVHTEGANNFIEALKNISVKLESYNINLDFNQRILNTLFN